MNLNNTFVLCPFCSCDAWHIGNVWFSCFLCGAKFFSKLNLSGKPAEVNSTLRMLKATGMYKLPEDDDYNNYPSRSNGGGGFSL